MGVDKHILVIGDSCQDIFKYCDVNRLCPDLPVPILNEKKEVRNEGMAKNVQRNILSLGYSCNIVTNANWQDITKTRFVHQESNHTFFRADSNEAMPSINLADVDYEHKMIVISDYDKGFLTKSDIETICGKHNNVFIDSKKVLGSWASGARYIKINETEYKRSKETITSEIQEKIIQTRGAEGSLFRGISYPVTKAEVKDVCGAGDSFLAALVVKFLEEENIEESIKYANYCASQVVTRRGVSVIP